MKNKRRGFTLIELLVVVLIIGILSAIALPQYTMAVEKARSAEALQNASSLRKALDLYILENDYPSSYTSFLGDNAAGSGMLDIDLESTLECDDYGCDSKYFHYAAYCGSSSCTVHAEKSRESGKDSGEYWIDWGRGKEDDEWTPICYYNNYEFDEDESEKFCKTLFPEFGRECGC